mmetsp:Transcript_1507/g.5553  ORF Transcript_1507/g.5553 Transcript_1507/m.5553 type:complete len:236 (+) Transcript_1507:778-1485(+)
MAKRRSVASAARVDARGTSAAARQNSRQKGRRPSRTTWGSGTPRRRRSQSCSRRGRTSTTRRIARRRLPSASAFDRAVPRRRGMPAGSLGRVAPRAPVARSSSPPIAPSSNGPRWTSSWRSSRARRLQRCAPWMRCRGSSSSSTLRSSPSLAQAPKTPRPGSRSSARPLPRATSAFCSKRSRQPRRASSKRNLSRATCSASSCASLCVSKASSSTSPSCARRSSCSRFCQSSVRT